MEIPSEDIQERRPKVQNKALSYGAWCACGGVEYGLVSSDAKKLTNAQREWNVMGPIHRTKWATLSDSGGIV